MLKQSLIDEACRDLSTCTDFLRWGETCLRRDQVFSGQGFADPWDETVQLLLHVLHLPADPDPRILGARLLHSEKQAFCRLLQRRINEQVPTAYLINEAWFCGLSFYVDERVLIPRSPIAELIEAGFQPWLEQEPTRVLDLCTGSGCIAIALAHAFPDAQVDASDISADALAVAQRNVADYQLEEQVTLLQGDGMKAVSGQYDLIVSNPPYVDAGDMASRPAEYHHEPELALASGEDGLDFTRQLLADAAKHLTDNGLLIVEVGNSAPALEAAFPQLPFFWFEFARGGSGVFMLSKAQLLQGLG